MVPAIYLGSVGVSTYWLMVAVGAVSMQVCIMRRRERFNLSALQTVGFNILLTVTGIAGAMLLFTIENLSNGLQIGGTSFFGSVFWVPLVMPLMGSVFHLRGGQSCDICAPCVALMVGSIRMGCFLNGCCGGNSVDLFGLEFCWPTQILESIGDFAIAAVLLAFEKQGRYTDKLYPLFMISYSAMRFLIEFLRNTSKEWLYMSHGQWFAICAIVIGMVWLLGTKKKENIK